MLHISFKNHGSSLFSSLGTVWQRNFPFLRYSLPSHSTTYDRGLPFHSLTFVTMPFLSNFLSAGFCIQTSSPFSNDSLLNCPFFFATLSTILFLFCKFSCMFRSSLL